jgi:hypothetical protein
VPAQLTDEAKDALRKAITICSLETARDLERALTTQFGKRVFGRINQKASIEAASESDRGITERLANAFDASLTAGRLAVGIAKSDRTFTPRNAAQRFFCLAAEQCEWAPQDGRTKTIAKPIIEFWPEAPESKHRFRKHNPADGLVSVLVRDFGTGLPRERMSETILSLNTEAKLQEFEAIGQFGHGGSGALAFCESCLITTQPRFNGARNEFYWTLIFPEREQVESKQDVIRKWFCDVDHLPLVGMLEDFPELAPAFPGTSIWHFGYNRGGWIKQIAGPEQSNPWGRLTRLFFSYPLPFEIRGVFARTDTETGKRTIKGAFYRIADQATEYKSGEKSERLTVEGATCGEARCVSPRQRAHHLLLPPRSLHRRSHAVVRGHLPRPNHVQLTRWKTGVRHLRMDLSQTVREVLSKPARGIVSSRRQYHARPVFEKDLLA